MNFDVEGVFNVLNGVTRGHFNIFNTWLKSATPIFDFQGSTNFIFPIKIYWGFTKGILILPGISHKNITNPKGRGFTP